MNRWLDPRRYARRLRRVGRRLLGRAPGRSRWLRDATITPGARIQVGAGAKGIAGWLNTDINGLAEYYLDAARPWPVPSGSIAYVYGDNFIEHIRLAHARAFLGHARQAMAPNGRIRLVTPDVGATAQLYLSDGPERQAALDRHRRHGYQVDHPVDLLRILYAESQHWLGYCFDEPSLRSELEVAGFVDIVRFRVGESDDPVLRGLEHRMEPIEDKMQLILEARTPS